MLDLTKSCADLKKLKAIFRDEDEHQLYWYFCLKNENERIFALTDFPDFVDMLDTETYNVKESTATTISQPQEKQMAFTFLKCLWRFCKSLPFRHEL